MSDHSDILAEKLRKDVWQIDMPHDLKTIKVVVGGNLNGSEIQICKDRSLIIYKEGYYAFV